MAMNSKWVALPFLFSFFTILWPTGCKSQKFSNKNFHFLSSYDQQSVSDIPSPLVTSLKFCLYMTNSLWVGMHLFFIRQSHLVYIIPWWLTGSAWSTTSWSHCILLHELQEVSGITLYVQAKLISWPNRESVKLLALSHFTLHSCLAGCKCCCISCCQSALPCPTTNRKWVELHICCPSSISFHEQEGEFCYCVGQAHLSPSYEQQQVSVLLLLHPNSHLIAGLQKVSNNTVCYIR